MATELVEKTLEDVGKFMGRFGEAYTAQLLNSKIQDAIQDVVQGVMPDSDDGPTNEEKSLQDKDSDVKPIAAGVTLVSYKLAWGPDHVEHRYYDLACWNIKPKDSVITNVTFRHRQLINLNNSMKKKSS